MTSKKAAGRIPAKQLATLVDNMVQQGVAPPLAPKSPADVGVMGLNTAVIRLRVRDVKPFEGNPRTSTNERITEICESIRTRGLDQMFAVTKRPGESHYITAKGGCTRLASLQRLAQEDPDRFEYADFWVYQYKSESDLLAGHLVENIQREGMSFWDTAQGILGMQTALEVEQKRELSSRDFEAELKQQGLETSRLILADYRFLHSYLSGVHADYRTAIGRNDIRYQLRPFFGLAEALWGKHPGLAAFDQTFPEWVSTYQDVNGYSADRLIEHLQSQLALRLDYSCDQVSSMLAILKVKKDASLDELTNPAQAPEDGVTTPPNDGHDRGHDAGSEFHQSSVLAEGGGGSTNDSANSTSSPTGGEPANESAPGAGGLGAGTDGDTAPSFGSLPAASGLMVATGLTPNPKTAPGNPGTLGAVTPIAPPSATQQQAFALNSAQASPLLDADPAPAGARVLDLVLECAESVGIEQYVVPASMPFGFFMEIPPEGALGVDAADLAVQGWWILANLSGQLNADLDVVLQSLDTRSELMLPDTGPDGFRACLGDEELWHDAVVDRLGGQTLLDAEFLLRVMTSATHPMADTLVEIVVAMRAVGRAEGGLL